MSDVDQEQKRPSLTLRSGTLGLNRPSEPGQVKQSFSHGRSKVVAVEVRKKRVILPGTAPEPTKAEAAAPATARAPLSLPTTPQSAPGATPESGEPRRVASVPRALTADERASRFRAVQDAQKADTEARYRAAIVEEDRRREEAELAAAEAERHAEEEARRKVEEEEAKKRTVEETKQRSVDEEARRKEEESRREVAERAGKAAAAKVAALAAAGKVAMPAEEEEEAPAAFRRGRPEIRRPVTPARRDEPRRRTGKITVTRALSDDDERTRSLASVRRARERERMRLHGELDQQKIVREVIVPETITVQELANRMAERGVDVVKSLMRMGVMATVNQVIDADTAELVVTEFGHRLRRVAESDVEIGMRGEDDTADELESRAPVVTVMGHVDHGKTSLLDALRATDVAGGEAGGITQHIGAYRVTVSSGKQITFIDTPGHQAFTAMRARGANATDIVVLVVAADDGIMEQTVEAIRHAKAAEVPIIVAINKIDRPDAKPERVRQELLQHELVVEELGGEVLDVEVSALKKTNLDRLEEAILLQAELLDLKANPNRPAEGVVLEAQLERGRGAIATVLIQRGTAKVGDIFVSGSVWGRVRALVNDRGENVREAGPSTPVEVLGLNGAPLAGDDFVVVESESRAREIAEYRERTRREKAAAASSRGTLEDMFSQITAGTAKELPIVIKADAQGSVEAINGSLNRLGTGEVAVRVLHSGVGGINESDVILAKATGAVIVGFNVRANPAARDLARRDGVEIRYYAIIYDVIDDMRNALSGMLAPTLRERFLGNASIREVFNITRVGKVAGCMVTEGVVRRGAKVRLLRDNVVIHEGALKTLKRFKDEVREVRDGYECGMAFENYENIATGDVIECFEIEEVARAL
ncbi:MAG TPA: translation initiation factor IF-2 [Stellaceae bacterium]|jgi:translation initiation factor IF-2|nr:translation initiation factor IF-2 [Stellaceae bacterium]